MKTGTEQTSEMCVSNTPQIMGNVRHNICIMNKLLPQAFRESLNVASVTHMKLSKMSCSFLK